VEVFWEGKGEGEVGTSRSLENEVERIRKRGYRALGLVRSGPI